MAKGKPYYKKFYKNQKKPWYNRKYTPAEVAYRAFSGVKYLKGLVNSEMLHNRIGGNVNFTNTGNVIALAGISQGDTDSGRTGNSIFARNLLLNLNIKCDSASTSPSFCRLILFQDNQQVSDTSPAVTDLLDSAYPNAPLSSANAGRFKVIRNWEFFIDKTTRPCKVVKQYFKMRHHIRYNGTGITDIQKGGLYLLFISDAASSVPVCGYQIKLGYHDN